MLSVALLAFNLCRLLHNKQNRIRYFVKYTIYYVKSKMARIFITGSSDGLGQLAAQWLIKQKHQVVLHARNERRAQDAMTIVPNADCVLIGDLGNFEETRQIAMDANATGAFDVVIHNAGVYRASEADILQINTLAPFILTCLMRKPQRLIYLSSSLHKQGRPALDQLKSGNGVNYSDSKLHMVMLAKAVTRAWSGVYANAVDPGWVPTKMGGAGAPDDLEQGFQTQAWLAVSDDDRAKVSGRYFYHKQESRYHRKADDASLQDAFIKACAHITGIPFPTDTP